jgi:hypothetical protein
MERPMNIFNLSAVNLRLKPEHPSLITEEKMVPAARRLVVLIPNGEFSDPELARKIDALGRSGRISILYLGLASSPTNDSLLRQHMAALSAYTRSPNREIDYQLIYRPNWPEALRGILKDGDQIICLENHFVADRFSRHTRLAGLLTTSLKAPVFVIQGISLHRDLQAAHATLRELLIWAGNLLTLGSFLIIQIWCTQAYPGTAGTILGIISVVVELGVILLINAWFDQSPV